MTDALAEKLTGLALDAAVSALTVLAPFLYLLLKHKENAAKIEDHTKQITDATITAKVAEKVAEMPLVKQAATEGVREALIEVPPPH